MFGKGKNDVIDFTALQKRGLIKKEEPKKSDLQMTKDGYINLSQRKEQEITSNEIALQNNNPFDILNSLASAANSTGEDENFITNQQPSPVQSIEFKHLSVKLDDLEYKIERLMEKIAEIEAKIKNSKSLTEN